MPFRGLFVGSMPDLQTRFSGEPRRTRSRAVGALRRPQRRQAKRDDGHQFGAGGRHGRGFAGGQGRWLASRRSGGCPERFSQSVRSGARQFRPNPQGHSEHEGRGNNVCHASFHLVPRRRLTGPVASKRRAKRPATISKPPSVITRSCGMWLRLFACPLRGFRIQSLRPSEASWNSKAPLRRGAFFISRREGNVDAALGLSRWRMSPPGR